LGRCFFSIIAMLVITLSSNSLIQSTFGQEPSDFHDQASSLPLNNNDLIVSMESEDIAVGAGDHVNFSITVTDSNSKPINEVDIDGKIIYPDGSHEKKFAGKTDENGKFVFPFNIDNNVSVGELKTQVKVTMPGFAPRLFSGVFIVVGASDSSPNGELDNNVQDHVQNPKSTKDAYSFVVAGDYGCDSTTRNTVNAMTKKNPDLVLALGDLSEVKDPDCFFDLFKPVYEQNKLKIVLGYHDTDSNGDDSSSRFSQYLSHFDLAEPFYSFDYKNIHFVAMSTGLNSIVPYEEETQQYEFIKSDLAQASINDKIDWIIVCGYRPFYTSPTAHPAPSSLDAYPPLFEKYGVDLVITAHNHNYQRTFPLSSNYEGSGDPVIKDKNVNDYNNPGAPIYVTVGTAGGDLYGFAGQAPFVAAQYRQTGFLDINVLKKGTQLKAEFLDNESNYDRDYFTINKS
jgi:calcineurin-like phosphoesterase family protein